MPAGITPIALLTPVAASSAVFSTRRASRGIDNLENNPLYAAANFQIAGGQVLKAGKAVKDMGIPLDFKASDKIKEMVPSKAVNGAKKVLTFTADHINPLIVCASGLKILGSDDKVDTAARESAGLVCMFGAEKAAKNFLGMPSYKVKNGEKPATNPEGSYKKLFSEKQIDAMKDFCGIKNNAKNARAIIGGAKGLLFVGASIGGYTLGSKIADAVLGKENKHV